MPPKSDAIRMRHMLDAAHKAILFTKDKSQSDLDTDEKLELALVRLVEIIGEAATNITRKVKEEFPSVPWNSIIGTRNRLIHGYDQVNRTVLWQIVAKDLPVLAESLKTALEAQERKEQQRDAYE